jgi:Dolichyl-phosphate-mannose-protein mannosyltransferase
MLTGVKSLFGVRRDATTIWRSSVFAVRLAALAMASVAFAAVLYGTGPAGPGLQESSGYYLGAADALVNGEGLRVPTAVWMSPDSTSTLTRYPPGYPAALALPIAMGFPPEQAARLVEALSAFVAMAVLLAVVGDAVGAGAAALLGVALLLTPALVDVHLAVLSEPLFLACVALTLATMVAMPDQPLAAGVCAAASLLVRYPGIGIVLGVVLWALIGGVPRRRRWVAVLLAALPTLVLGIGGLAWAPGLRTAIGRRLGVFPGLGSALVGAARTVTLWLAPTAHRVDWGWMVALPAALGVVGMLVVGGRRVYRLWRLLPADLPVQSSTTVPQLVAARTLGGAVLLGVTYAASLVGGRMFADGYVTFDYRLLSPIIVLVSVAFAIAAANWWRSARRAARAVLGALLLAWGVAAGTASRQHVRNALEVGLDLGQDGWRRSGMLEWARNDGASHALYSNLPMLGYLYLARPVRGLPQTSDPATLRAFADTLAARGGVVLMADVPSPRFMDADALIRTGGLRVVATYENGRVLAPPAPLAP